MILCVHQGEVELHMTSLTGSQKGAKASAWGDESEDGDLWGDVETSTRLDSASSAMSCISPGSSVLLHQKLSSPSRKRPMEEKVPYHTYHAIPYLSNAPWKRRCGKIQLPPPAPPYYPFPRGKIHTRGKICGFTVG